MSRDPHPLIAHSALWYAFLGAPIAWGLDLVIRYGPVELACEKVGGTFLAGVTAATVLLALGAGAVGWLAWSRARAAGPEVDAVALRRTRWMGLSGMILSGFFTVVIAAQALPSLLVAPCLRGP